MSDAVLIALIGSLGTVFGAVATTVASRWAHRPALPPPAAPAADVAAAPELEETLPVLGEAIDVRELRILRALFGEPKGRALEAYKIAYYKPSLDATVRKGWVQHVNGKYRMTPKGADFCRTYLKQTILGWHPTA